MSTDDILICHCLISGYLSEAAELCARERVLLIADEIQTGLGRTGALMACEHENVKPDVYVLGKALSGGMYPVSAVVSSEEVLGVFRPGSHGSTYGGNPLACAVARAALRVIEDERLPDRSAELGRWLLYELRKLRHPHIKSVRGRGLLIGIELMVPARSYCERLKDLGLLCKETHDYVVRLAPPLIISQEDLAWAVGSCGRPSRDSAGYPLRSANASSISFLASGPGGVSGRRGGPP